MTLDFETSITGGPLAAGTIVEDLFAGVAIDVSCRNNHWHHPDECLIFDSANPSRSDRDLGTPNEDFAGPGKGSGGKAGAKGENSVPFDNILIIAEDVCDTDNDGLVDEPDDEARGGTFRFDFDEPVEIQSLEMIDIDLDECGGGVVICTDGNGAQTFIDIPVAGNNSVQTVDVGIADVTRMEVSIVSSGAIGSIDLCSDCIPLTCEDFKNVPCGLQDDSCGGLIGCGYCPEGETCNDQGICIPECVPTTCEDEERECGTFDDGCGGTLDCGGCPIGHTCDEEGTCVPVCNPTTCEDEERECGTIPDGCGGTLDCGGCPAGEICDEEGTCIPEPFPICAPQSCAQQGFECGIHNDGCGRTLRCGSCPSGEVCNRESRCVEECFPTTCRAEGRECGTVADGCGGSLYCGYCDVNEVCNANGICVAG